MGRTKTPWIAMAAAAVLVAAGCSGGGASADRTSGDGEPRAQNSVDSTPATLEVTPKDGASEVTPDTTVEVTATNGTISSVTVKDGKGHSVPGEIAGSTWTASAQLMPEATYTVTVKAAGPGGAESTEKTTFTTLTPGITATYGILYTDQKVGVAMPAIIQFDSEVTDKAYRQKIEKAVSVKTTPEVEGAWGWLDNRQLMWRPKEFFATGTKVEINAPLTGFQTGPDKWVANDSTGTMTIGRNQTSVVDLAKHKMTVKRDGKTVKTFPVSGGRPGPDTETRSGMKVIMTKEPAVTMDSASLGIKKGDPGYYRIDTNWNMRVTWTGEYVHSAPWSQGSQGYANVSHGCVNMAPGDAKWMFDNSLIGDPMDFTGSSREFAPTEGIGVWQFSWAKWQRQSALETS